MQTTKDLLQTALEKQSASEWSRTYNVRPGTFSNAKNIGRLSPVLAGCLAIDLGEDPKHWMAIAAMESERDNKLKAHLRQAMHMTKE